MLLGGAHRDGDVHILAHMDGILANRDPYVVVLLRPLRFGCLRLARQFVGYTHLGLLIGTFLFNNHTFK
jgi:hypothetical protein